MAERVRFCNYDENIDEDVINILNKLNDLNYRTLHSCSGHPTMHIKDQSDHSWGNDAFIPWENVLSLSAYIVIYGVEIKHMGCPEHWRWDMRKEPDTCYDNYIERSVICSTLRVNNIPYTLKENQMTDIDGLIRGKEVYDELLTLKQKAMRTLSKWIDTLPYNLSDKDYAMPPDWKPKQVIFD